MRASSIHSTELPPPPAERENLRNTAGQAPSSSTSAQGIGDALIGLHRRRSSVASRGAARMLHQSLEQELETSFDTSWHPLYAPRSEAAVSRPLPLPSARYLKAYGVPLGDLQLERDILTTDDLRALVRSLAQHCSLKQLKAMLDAAKVSRPSLPPDDDPNRVASHRGALVRALLELLNPRMRKAALRAAVGEYAPQFGVSTSDSRVSDATLKAMLNAAADNGRLPMNLTECALLPDALTERLRQQAKEAGAMMALPSQSDPNDEGDAQRVMAALEELQIEGTISEAQYVAAVNRVAILLGYEAAHGRDAG